MHFLCFSQDTGSTKKMLRSGMFAFVTFILPFLMSSPRSTHRITKGSPFIRSLALVRLSQTRNEIHIEQFADPSSPLPPSVLLIFFFHPQGSPSHMASHRTHLGI